MENTTGANVNRRLNGVNRDQVVTHRVSPAERQMIDVIAQRNEMSPSELWRTCLDWLDLELVDYEEYANGYLALTSTDGDKFWIEEDSFLELLEQLGLYEPQNNTPPMEILHKEWASIRPNLNRWVRDNIQEFTRRVTKYEPMSCLDSPEVKS